MRKLKVNDVYSFTYRPEVAKDKFEPYHCFDGQLIVKQYDSGKFYLEDTYWTSNNRTFTRTEALKQGFLKFKCNLDDVDEIIQCDVIYYEDKDIVNLSHQHGCYKRFVLKKGAKRSKKKMLFAAKKMISDHENKINYSSREIEQLKEKIKKIKSNNLDIYL